MPCGFSKPFIVALFFTVPVVLEGCVEPRIFTPIPPTVPNPLLPTNAQYTGTAAKGRRPLFAWTESESPLLPVEYELQVAAEPAFLSLKIDERVNDTTFQPYEDLEVSAVPPVGTRYFWRVRACHSKGCSDYSSPRAVFVGRSGQDFNGDGYADLAIGAPGNTTDTGRAYVYFGGAERPWNTVADGTLSDSTAGGSFGAEIATLPDFNGDGFADLIVGAPSYGAANLPGYAYIYFGGAGTSFDTTADLILSSNRPGDRFGDALAAAGEMNADGFSDVVVAAPRSDGNGIDTGRAIVFLGGHSGGQDVPRAVFEGSPFASLFGHRVSSVDDVNADGYADIIIDEAVYDERNGVQNCISRIFLGSREEISNTSVIGIRRSTTAKCYPRSSGAGDLNGDKIPDIANVLSTINGGLVQLYFSTSPFDDVPDATLQAVDYVGDIVAGRDVNDDGKPDLAITEGRSSQSSVHLALANEAGGFDPFIKLASDVDSKARVAFLPDVNGDGIDDVLVGSPDDVNGNGAGHTALYFGSPGRTFDTRTDAVWTESGAVRFGTSLAAP